MFAEVAVPVPLRQAFTYAVPEALASQLQAGHRVAVPFGHQKVPGVVTGLVKERPSHLKRIRSIAALLEEEPVFTDELLRFLVEAAAYYMHPIGDVLRAAAPMLLADSLKALKASGFLSSTRQLKGARISEHKDIVIELVPNIVHEDIKLGKKQAEIWQFLLTQTPITLDAMRIAIKDSRKWVRQFEEKGWIRTHEREGIWDRRQEMPAKEAGYALSADQQHAVNAIYGAIAREQGQGLLLYGVTGSGKTEVYLRAIQATLERGKSAILMVPEIALTPQLVSVFSQRIHPEPVVLHSGLTPRERFDAWRALRSGKAKFAIGARSAIFAPAEDLGLLIVDEEHENTFKQEEGFRYQTRDLALLRAHLAKAVCVLGSATPSLEAYALAEQGRIQKLSLPHRVTPHPRPVMEVVDLRRHRNGPTQHPLITGPLYRALQACFEQKGQAMLFLNRRGFAPTVACGACGAAIECPHCAVTLTEHRGARLLRCHTCDHQQRKPEVCGACGSKELVSLGQGTERIEEALQEAFPAQRFGRLDRDTANETGIETVLQAFRDHAYDALVGTQMITKGHDIPNVTLVGVLLADQSLGFPDFRASERTFQLIEQVSGRAGRGDKPGKVILQTYQPEHPVMQFAVAHDYDSFFAYESGHRKMLGYPPHGRAVEIRLEGDDESEVQSVGESLAQAASRYAKQKKIDAVRLLGPAPAPIARVRGRFRYRLYLMGPERHDVRQLTRVIIAQLDRTPKIKVSIDIDP